MQTPLRSEVGPVRGRGRRKHGLYTEKLCKFRSGTLLEQRAQESQDTEPPLWTRGLRLHASLVRRGATRERLVPIRATMRPDSSSHLASVRLRGTTSGNTWCRPNPWNRHGTWDGRNPWRRAGTHGVATAHSIAGVQGVAGADGVAGIHGVAAAHVIVPNHGVAATHAPQPNGPPQPIGSLWDRHNP